MTAFVEPSSYSSRNVRASLDHSGWPGSLRSTNDTFVTQLNPAGARISRYDDDALASQALLSRQVDIMVTSDALGIALARQNPQAGLENRMVLSSAPFSFGIRRHEPDWLHFLNTWIFLNRLNGTLGRLFEKWLERPMPEMGSF